MALGEARSCPVPGEGVSQTAELTTEQSAVLAAGSSSFRDLPWRRTRDPWAVLVSEVMLQQTQAERVIPRWERFVERWPTAAACAAASVGDVLIEWSGLGYPRRARNLWSTAGICVERHGGTLPSDLDQLLALPGVGRYTARAVMAYAFDLDTGVVDTNVARILARRAGRRLTPSAAQDAADSWTPSGRSWEWNQVLMDLGAQRCRPVPDCEGCPVGCRWRDEGHPHPDPAAGSAGVSRRQARYAGSDRELRGRILRAIAEGAEPAAAVEASILAGGVGPERLAAVVASLVRDGLAVRGDDGVLRHP